MEPTIELDEKIKISYVNYKSVLSNKIKIVCAKINVSYNEIKWIVFDPKLCSSDGKVPNELQKIMIGNNGKDYGSCRVSEGKIWISTLSIYEDVKQNNSINIVYKSISRQKFERDILADVIMDELAHIFTESDHGSHEYDSTLELYHNRYYIK